MPDTSALSWIPTANAVDWALVAIVLLGAWGGWRRGFVAVASNLLALAASVALAFAAFQPLAAWLQREAPRLQDWAMPIAFVLVFAVALALLGALARALVRATPPRAQRHAINRLLGMLPGAINGAIVATLAAVLLLSVPFSGVVATLSRDSTLASALAAPAEAAQAALEPVFAAPLRRAMYSRLMPADERSSVELPFKVADPQDRPDLEAQMLALLNAERAQHGLRPLRADPELADVARAHSRDMFRRGYFSHTTPDHADPFDRLRQAHVRFLTAGENLALAPDLAAAQEGLMKSPGHRANILRSQFGRVGIGIEDGGPHGLMVTQNFRN